MLDKLPPHSFVGRAQVLVRPIESRAPGPKDAVAAAGGRARVALVRLHPGPASTATNTARCPCQCQELLYCYPPRY